MGKVQLGMIWFPQQNGDGELTDLVDPNNSAKPLFDEDDEESWGMKHVSVEGYQGNYAGNKTTTYHK